LRHQKLSIYKNQPQRQPIHKFSLSLMVELFDFASLTQLKQEVLLTLYFNKPFYRVQLLPSSYFSPLNEQHISRVNLRFEENCSFQPILLLNSID